MHTFHSKTYLISLLTLLLSSLIIIFIFNILIDPFDKTNSNIFHIKNKIAISTREEKIALSKNISHIDNLIIGSSRCMKLDPKIVSQYLYGNTFNFSVNSATPEDYLAILTFLEKENKIPKNIILGIDFYTLNPEYINQDITESEELNPTHQINYVNFLTGFLSWDTTKASYLTLLQNINHTEPSSHFDTDGYFYNMALDQRIAAQEFDFDAAIKASAKDYFHKNYSNGKYETLSMNRLKILANFFTMCQKHDIKLYVFITPVHKFQLDMIMHDKTLSKTLIAFKTALSYQTDYYDFMLYNPLIDNNKLFYDSVHYRDILAEIILMKVLQSEGNFGKFIPKENRHDI